MFANKTSAEHGKYYLFIAKTMNIFHCLAQKHDPKTVCSFFAENIISVTILCFVKNYGKYMHNYSTNCIQCFANVLPPNICQCLQ